MAGAHSHCCAVSKDRNEWSSKGVKLPSNLNFEKLCYNMLIMQVVRIHKTSPKLPPSFPPLFPYPLATEKKQTDVTETASLGTLSVTLHPHIPNVFSVI